MIYADICSGISAAKVAWRPLGWRAAWYSEIEPFPCAALAHHYPYTPNLGDMSRYKDWPDAALDLLVGGTPCQSFSVAGLRKGLADPRGNLMLTYLAIAARYRPRWLVWENVPGVLSTDSGRAFGTFLGALAELGYGFAYRILDAQYIRVESHARAVPQRRRRVFVVGYLGDWRPPAAVLFERESLRGYPPPCRKAGQGVAGTIAGGARKRGGFSYDDVPVVGRALTTSNQRIDAETETLLVANPLRAQAQPSHRADSDTYIPIAFDCKASGQNGFGVGEIASTMRSMGHLGSHQNGGGHLAVAFQCHGSNVGEMGTLRKGNGHVTGEVPFAAQGSAVRRLTPMECERLQGFTDRYTAIPFNGGLSADGPRYKALGNSMAVNTMRWLGERVQLVNDIFAGRQ